MTCPRSGRRTHGYGEIILLYLLWLCYGVVNLIPSSHARRYYLCMQLANAQAGQATINIIPSMTNLGPPQAVEFRQLPLKGGSQPSITLHCSGGLSKNLRIKSKKHNSALVRVSNAEEKS